MGEDGHFHDEEVDRIRRKARRLTTILVVFVGVIVVPLLAVFVYLTWFFRVAG